MPLPTTPPIPSRAGRIGDTDVCGQAVEVAYTLSATTERCSKKGNSCARHEACAQRRQSQCPGHTHRSGEPRLGVCADPLSTSSRSKWTTVRGSHDARFSRASAGSIKRFPAASMSSTPQLSPSSLCAVVPFESLVSL